MLMSSIGPGHDINIEFCETHCGLKWSTTISLIIMQCSDKATAVIQKLSSYMKHSSAPSRSQNVVEQPSITPEKPGKYVCHVQLEHILPHSVDRVTLI